VIDSASLALSVSFSVPADGVGAKCVFQSAGPIKGQKHLRSTRETNAWAATVLIDELNARALERSTQCSIVRSSQRGLGFCEFGPANSCDPHPRFFSQIVCAPSEQGASPTYLRTPQCRKELP
jgi:hypothetical protein